MLESVKEGSRGLRRCHTSRVPPRPRTVQLEKREEMVPKACAKLTDICKQQLSFVSSPYKSSSENRAEISKHGLKNG